MNPIEIAALIEKSYHYVEDMAACLEAQHYEHLPHLEQEYATVINALQSVDAEHIQPFIVDLECISTRLSELRDVMVVQRDIVRGHLQGMGQTSHAAKAYLKSTLVTPDKKS
jgi:hypothetical protein